MDECSDTLELESRKRTKRSEAKPNQTIPFLVRQITNQIPFLNLIYPRAETHLSTTTTTNQSTSFEASYLPLDDRMERKVTVPPPLLSRVYYVFI